MIDAIETRYAGCRFRSRLEARWAVFMDRLAIKWEYEPQGYEFGSFRYLPDFYLPSADQFVEVKGEDEALREALPTLRRFAREVRKNVVILGEVPRVGPAARSPIHPCLYLINGEVVSLAAVVVATPQVHFIPTLVSLPPGNVTTKTQTIGAHPLGEIADAYQAARSARFEHGESGAA